MEKEDIKFLAINYMSAWNANNDQVLEEFADENLYVFYTHFPKKIDLQAFRDTLLQTYTYFPDIKIDIVRTTICENIAFVEWYYTGTHKSGNIFGVAESHKHVKVNGMSRIECENGKVIKDSGLVDNLSLAIQIGALKV